jgi:hypothetical protein
MPIPFPWHAAKHHDAGCLPLLFLFNETSSKLLFLSGCPTEFFLLEFHETGAKYCFAVLQN